MKAVSETSSEDSDYCPGKKKNKTRGRGRARKRKASDGEESSENGKKKGYRGRRKKRPPTPDSFSDDLEPSSSELNFGASDGEDFQVEELNTDDEDFCSPKGRNYQRQIARAGERSSV
jgi:hypothetical protein